MHDVAILAAQAWADANKHREHSPQAFGAGVAQAYSACLAGRGEIAPGNAVVDAERLLAESERTRSLVQVMYDALWSPELLAIKPPAECESTRMDAAQAALTESVARLSAAWAEFGLQTPESSRPEQPSPKGWRSRARTRFAAILQRLADGLGGSKR